MLYLKASKKGCIICGISSINTVLRYNFYNKSSKDLKIIRDQMFKKHYVFRDATN